MAWVCSQLSNPNILTGQRTCTEWILLENQQQTIVPDLSAVERDEILLWIVLVFSTVWGINRIKRMFGS